MARTFIQQDTQVRNSETYDDTIAAGLTLETGQTNLMGDLNALRSQIKRAIWADSAGDWFSDIQTANAKKRAITALNADLDDLEEKRILFRVDKLQDIAVPGGQNYVVLSNASSETPAETAAVNAGTSVGAVVATLAGDVGSHALTEVTGANPLSPKNLCIVRNASTGDDVLSSGRSVYGLLQAETGTANGDAFNDTNKQAQISFVRPNSTGDDLEACPVGDIAGLTINYSYIRRVRFDDIPETAFLTGHFVDAAASSAVTLDSAIDNQVGAATQAQNIRVQIADSFSWDFEDSTGTADILSVKAAAGADEVEFNVDLFDVNNASDADFLNGAIFDSGGTPLRVGVTAGYIDTASADLGVRAGGELLLDDGNQAGSSWAQTTGIKLSDTTQEWSDFETAFGGEVSILRAATLSKRRTPTFAVVTATTNADVDVGGTGGGSNLDAQLPDMSIGAFVGGYDIYVNGVLMRPGANSAANHDVYPGTSLANGQLRFEFRLKVGDQICVIPYER